MSPNQLIPIKNPELGGGFGVKGYGIAQMRIARWCVVEPRLEFRQNLNSFLALKR
jgi:hypothetical protein